MGPAIFVRYYREFVITGEVYVDYVDLGLKKLKKLVCYNREFVITEFVITEFDCNCFYQELAGPPGAARDYFTISL